MKMKTYFHFHFIYRVYDLFIKRDKGYKMLKIGLLCIGLFFTNLFAQNNIVSTSIDKNFKAVIISKEKVTIGKNKFSIEIFDKSKKLSNNFVKLTLHRPDNKEIYYNNIKKETYKNELIIELPVKGKYNYKLDFSKTVGGVIYTTRGSFLVK